MPINPRTHRTDLSHGHQRILVGDVLSQLRTLPDNSVQCCVTSPPYWGLRDYGVEGQIGSEKTPEEFVARMVEVFREVRRVLRPDATLWLNLGDTYAHSLRQSGSAHAGVKQNTNNGSIRAGFRPLPVGLKEKDLVGIPWRVAFALQADGWWLRQDIIWCLSPSTNVYVRSQKGEMPMTLKDASRLRPDTIKMWDGKKWNQVVAWRRSAGDTGRKIVLRSGEVIRATDKHLWPTNRGLLTTMDLQVGDTLLTCKLPDSMAHTPTYMSNDLAWLIGLFLAEGSYANDTMQLSLSADEVRWLPRITRAAASMGATTTHTVTGNMLAVRMYGRVLRAVLSNFVAGRSAKAKHLSSTIWMLPNEVLISIVEGYLDGDGHKDGTRIRLGFCRNYNLERDLRVLAARLGATLTLTRTTATYQHGNRPAFRGEWRWNRTGHHNQKDRGEIVGLSPIRCRGFIDVTLKSPPNLFAMSSGVLTHNCKPNPMPSSVTDRCTTAHEYLFLLTKSPRYYFDAVAIAEPTSPNSTFCNPPAHVTPYAKAVNRPDQTKLGCGSRGNPEARNKRDVWTISTQAYKGAHFATFPELLVEPCILAGTSERGCCSKCGTPYRRQVVSERVPTRPGRDTKVEGTTSDVSGNRDPERHVTAKHTVGWDQMCRCVALGTPYDSLIPEVAPCVVLDPFCGSGTTLTVAEHHGRKGIGIELNPEYARLAIERIKAGCKRVGKAEK